MFTSNAMSSWRGVIFYLPTFCRLSMWQFKNLLFASPYIELAYIFEASYSTLVTSWAKNQVSTNQNSRNRWCKIVRRTICKNMNNDTLLFPKGLTWYHLQKQLIVSCYRAYLEAPLLHECFHWTKFFFLFCGFLWVNYMLQ